MLSTKVGRQHAGKMAGKPLGKRAKTATERQREWRARVARAKKLEQHADKRQARDDRERQLAERTVAASKQLGAQLYGVLLVDPPWRFEPWSRETGMDRAADNHYPTMTIDEIKALAVPAAPDCILYMWATGPMLDTAIDVVRAWGFSHNTAQIWDKGQLGLGYRVRAEAEILLIATRGKVPAPAPGTQPRQIIRAPRGRHSEKPDKFADEIARLYPTTPKLEMFARKPRAGWDTWGNEA